MNNVTVMNSLFLQEFMLNVSAYHDTQPPLWPFNTPVPKNYCHSDMTPGCLSGDFGLKDVMSQEKINGTQPQAEKMMSLL